MQCSETRELLSAYIDGVLDTNENSAVREHLRICSECSRNLADLQETIRLLRSLGEVTPPESFRQELRARLEREPLPAGRIKNLIWTQKARYWLSGPGKYLAASVVIIGLGVSTGLYNLLQSGLFPQSASYDMALEQKAGDRVALESAPEKSKADSMTDMQLNDQDAGSTKASATDPVKDTAGKQKITSDESDMLHQPDGNRLPEQNEMFIAGAPADEALRKALAPEGKGGGAVEPAADQPAGNSDNYSLANPEGVNPGIVDSGTTNSGTIGSGTTGSGTAESGAVSQEATGSDPAASVSSAPEDSSGAGSTSPVQPFVESSGEMVTAMRVPESETTALEAYPKAPEKRAGNQATNPDSDTGVSNESENPAGEEALLNQQRLISQSTRTEPAGETGEISIAADVSGAAAPGSNVKDRDQEAAKDGFLSIEVSDYDDFDSKLTVLVDRFNGIVESTASTAGKSVSAGFVIRVPVNNFNEMLRQIEALGRVTGKKVSDRDVSAEIAETQSRMSNLQKEEERLLGLVDKAKSLDEALTLEKELARVRDEMEKTQGKLNTLNVSGKFSLIRLDIREAVAAEAEPALQTSTAGWLLPTALVASGIGGLAYYFRIRRKG